MRTKFYLASLALATMAVGCQNEEFIEKTVQNADGLVELDENFMIASVGEDAETRTHWSLTNGDLVNAFVPTWSVATPTGDNPIDGMVKSDEIGLCWTGVSADGTGTSGSTVLTNYQFFHFGWLGKGEEAANLGQCPDDGLLNGWLYSDVKAKSGLTDKEGKEVVVVDPDLDDENDVVEVAPNDDKVAINKNGKTLDFKTDVNLNSGIYKTDNKAIFGGEYIAYYPYNSDFKDKGCIPAVSKTVYDNVQVGGAGLTDPELAKATFRYSDVAMVNGGTEATKFGFHNLSGLLYLQVNNTGSNPTPTTGDNGVNIDKVVFYSANSAFKKAVKLDASSIKAGKKGTALYAETVETSKSITVNIIEDEDGNYLTVAKKGDATNYITVAALPTTISDLKVLLHNGASGHEGWAEYAIGETKVNAGLPTFLKLTVNAADFRKVFYATDQATLEVALTQAATAAQTESKPATVKVLGDITLTESVDVKANVIVEGDKLIVPEGVTLTLEDDATVKSGIDVLGQTCCGTASAAGKLTVKAATLAGNVHAYNGYAGKQSATVELTGPDQKDAKAFLTGSMVLDSNTALKIVSEADFNTRGAKIENNGEFTVEGKFAVLDASGKTNAAAGKDFTNNGTFIDKIGSTVGGATQFMVNNGDYICEVESQKRMDEAYRNKKACNIIDIVKTETTVYILNVEKHNGKDVDIWVSAGSATNAQDAVKLQSPSQKVNNKTVYSRVAIGNLLVEGGKRASVQSEALIDVNGNIALNGMLVLEKDVKKMTAKNLTVNAYGRVHYRVRETSNEVTMAVENCITVNKDGLFEIAAPTGSQNIALVTCRELVEGGTFTGGKPEIVE